MLRKMRCARLVPILLSLSGAPLAGGCAGTPASTREVRVPLACHLPSFPRMGEVTFDAVDLDPPGAPDGKPDLLVIEPAHLALLSAWVVAVDEWRDLVVRCPGVTVGPLGDLARGIGK